MDSPSGEMKAVMRESTIKGEDKQFLEVGLFAHLFTFNMT